MRTSKRAPAFTAAFVRVARFVATALGRWPVLSLEGRVVIITGGSRGLGLAIAREATRRGARLVLIARDEDELSAAREELRARGAEVLAIPCDVTDRAAATSAVAQASDWCGRIDVLINDAGVIEVGPLRSMREEDFEVAMATHFRAPLHLAYEVLPHMRGAGSGRIVNIASIGGLVAVPHLAPYCASKFALVGLSEALRVELAKEGVAVTTICPGLMRTGSGRAARFKGNVEAENAWFRASAVAPLVTMSAERAARRILRACERGEGLVRLGVPAKLAGVAHGLAPGLTSSALSLVGRFLPEAPAASAHREPREGRAIPVHSLWVKRRDERDAREHNEIRARA